MAPGYRNSGDTVPVHRQDPNLLVTSSQPPAGVAGGDDPLPAIEVLQVSGEAFTGQLLQWLRRSEDGSINYIEGAKEPTYLVTAHDVDSYLAVEVQPMDNRGRKVKQLGPSPMKGGRSLMFIKSRAASSLQSVCEPATYRLHITSQVSGMGGVGKILAAGEMVWWDPSHS